MQYDCEELQLDAECIFDQLKQDPAYYGSCQHLTMKSAYQAVIEAISVLHTIPGSVEEGNGELSTEGAMVISLLQQWLIRHICKSLMRLMTTEALILHHKNIPKAYIDNYLTYQQHFSLKELISHHYQAVQSCSG